ncbi:hypothetical protein [Comamonas sp. JC664]|uniref:hypothetical protein n=1 Tax=Comamonas sp. JC664 TaxID=2801917 RepID=UPI001749FCAD|nr:hypothetical protein [Comamonas sp. JC664]MBL0695393.1 hypothetical protein [Comamonas sp. JC664]GHG87777.1 hypothetical protein GCM10012319_45930 [Comamonas sp. KCTC 72670]
MRASRLVASLTAVLALSLTACGVEDASMDMPDAEALDSVEQAQGIPPHCPNNDLFYWLENVQACMSCGSVRQPGQQATQYAACRSNATNTRTLINVRYCILGCDPL